MPIEHSFAGVVVAGDDASLANREIRGLLSLVARNAKVEKRVWPKDLRVRSLLAVVEVDDVRHDEREALVCRLTSTFTGPRRKSLFPKSARPAAPCATYCYA